MQPPFQRWENSFLAPLFCTEVESLMFKFLYTERVTFALEIFYKISTKVGAEIAPLKFLKFFFPKPKQLRNVLRGLLEYDLSACQVSFFCLNFPH